MRPDFFDFGGSVTTAVAKVTAQQWQSSSAALSHIEGRFAVNVHGFCMQLLGN